MKRDWNFCTRQRQVPPVTMTDAAAAAARMTWALLDCAASTCCSVWRLLRCCPTEVTAWQPAWLCCLLLLWQQQVAACNAQACCCCGRQEFAGLLWFGGGDAAVCDVKCEAGSSSSSKCWLCLHSMPSRDCLAGCAACSTAAAASGQELSCTAWLAAAGHSCSTILSGGTSSVGRCRLAVQHTLAVFEVAARGRVQGRQLCHGSWLRC